jgi:hypothetical protein
MVFSAAENEQYGKARLASGNGIIGMQGEGESEVIDSRG